jgi:hypothetical protein
VQDAPPLRELQCSADAVKKAIEGHTRIEKAAAAVLSKEEWKEAQLAHRSMKASSEEGVIHTPERTLQPSTL